MRFLTADYLFPLHIAPIKKGVLQISEKGEVVEIFKNREAVPKEKLEIFKGILSPGFVNAHCHLELSHMLGKLPKKTGLPDFISKIPKQRNKDPSKIKESIIEADLMMKRNGIVAVGDISNTTDSFFIKRESNINYYTFVEVFAINPNKADDAFKEGLKILQYCPKPNSLVPHATYSVSSALFSKIKDHNKGEIICIHNQETDTEDELFKNGRGILYKYLKNFGELSITGKSALQTVLLQLPNNARLILTHNTFTKKEDIDWVIKNNYSAYYCTCPKANLYIEGVLPDYSIFDIDKLCVGTDSLASNNSLSILDELLVIKENSNFDKNTLLKIGAKNGAEALGFTDLGTFERGKTPGVNLIQDFEKVIIID